MRGSAVAIAALILAGCAVVTAQSGLPPTCVPSSSPARRVFVIVGGTHSLLRERAWWRPHSAFARGLEAHGHTLVNPDRAFAWTSDVDGVLPWRRRRTWSIEGEHLYWYLRANTRGDQLPSVIAHSHGGQVIAYAARFGQRFDLVVTMAVPVRQDMEAEYARLRERTRRWVHLYATRDVIQIAGALFDGRLGIFRRMPLADENIRLEGRDHGYLDPAAWDRHRLWPCLSS